MEPQLKSLLEAAVRRAKYTFVLGSSNKKAQLKKTGLWSCEAYHRKLNMASYKKYDNKWALADTLLPGYLDKIYPIKASDDPLKSMPLFLNRGARNLIKHAKASEVTRQGNCGEISFYIAHYLWKNSKKLITSINVARLVNFDHVFVIVNGEWVIDLWENEIEPIYNISEMPKRSIELLKFLKEQQRFLLATNISKNKKEYIELKKAIPVYQSGYDSGAPVELPFLSKIFFSPAQVPYPVFDPNSAMDITDYYTIPPLRMALTATLRKYHQQKFQPCLTEINEGKTELKSKR